MILAVANQKGGVTYGEMLLTGLKMYLIQGHEPVKKDARLP